MCGAFSIVHPFREIGKHYNAGYNRELDNSRPRFNVRPSQAVPVVLSRKSTEIRLAYWGMEFVFQNEKKHFLINARNDSLNKNFWSVLLKGNRCLVPADGFYEWKMTDKIKQPYYFTQISDDLFSFAGLWQMQKARDGKLEIKFVIITTESNKIVGMVHDRMPAMLSSEQEKVWINPTSTERELFKVLEPFNFSEMKYWRVQNLVNNPKYDTPELVKEA